MPDPSFFAAPPLPRLRWLVQLRWAALAVALAGLIVALVAGLPWVAPAPIAISIGLGAVYNLYFTLRLRDLPRRPNPATAREFHLHALADVCALTLLMLAAGGLRNPICTFYGFHVVLGALIGLLRGALLSALAGLGGAAFLILAERFHLLLAPPLTEPPLWLAAGAISTNILILGYFSLGAVRFLQREQGRATRNYELLLSGLDTLHVGLTLVGPDRKILLRNDRAATLHPCPGDLFQLPPGPPHGPLGAPHVAPFGPDARDITPPDDDTPRRFAHIQDGEPRIIEILPLSGPSGGDALRAYLYVDRTEATVNEQRAIMLERLASLGRAMQAVAHELNTPLSSIQTLAVDLSHGPRSPDDAESIALIIDEARRCGEITRELLATAQRAPDGARARTQVRLADVVRRAAKLAFGFKAGPGSTQIALRGPTDLSCVTDADRVLQILVNLLQNARDAADAPVEITLTRLPDSASIEVRDHGPGLPPEVRARLFTPFITTKPPGKGTGLGLYTCARLSQQLDGNLTVDNAPGGGVCARLVLPLISPGHPAAHS